MDQELKDAEFEDLLVRYLDDDLSDEELRNFTSQLESSEEKCRLLAEYSLQATIIQENQPDVLSPYLKEKPGAVCEIKPARSKIIPFLTALAAVLVISFAVLSSKSVTDESFVTIKESSNTSWEGSAKINNSKLGKGLIKVNKGVLELDFKNGVVAIVDSSTEMELIDEMNVRLISGKAVFRVPPQAIGFSAVTETANVIDLGTEFGVAVRDDKSTDIQVYEGEVKASPKNIAEMKLLESGQALRVSSADDAYAIGFKFDRFVRYLPGPGDPNGRGTWPYNTATLREINIMPAPAGVEIDGDLSDWDLSGRFKSKCDPPYGEFYYVEGSMMYDENFLYIGAHVGDPYPMRSNILHTDDRQGFGSGGAVALRLSFDRKMGWPCKGKFTDKLTPENISKLNKKHMFAIMWYERPTKLASLHLMTGMSHHKPKLNPEGYHGAFKKDADGRGYTMEYRIPWTLLSADDDPPQAGDILGMTWVNHWSGAEGRNFKGQLVDIVNPDAEGWNFQNAATWGRAIYRKKSR